MKYNELIKEAFIARKSSYAPFSHFLVGDVLLPADAMVYLACNIESAAHTLSWCAAWTPFFKAISSNERDFKAIAIVAAAADTPQDQYEYCAPCGVCRQVMAEFCDLDEFEVILAKNEEEYKVYSLNELLPLSFTGKDLE